MQSHDKDTTSDLDSQYINHVSCANLNDIINPVVLYYGVKLSHRVVSYLNIKNF